MAVRQYPLFIDGHWVDANGRGGVLLKARTEVKSISINIA